MNSCNKNVEPDGIGENNPPVALFTVTPGNGNTLTIFLFDASESSDEDEDNSNLQIRWDFNGDGNWDTEWSVDRLVYHQYATQGTYNCTLQVIDSEGEISTAAKAVDVTAAVTYTDPRDNQVYSTLTLGSQTWFAQNLNYDTVGTWCYLNNQAYCDNVGRLYDHETALVACPPGWHLPSDQEWKELEIFLGMSAAEANNTLWRGSDQGSQLKAIYSWYQNGNGSNSSGFTALASGWYFTNYGYWQSETASTIFRTSTESTSDPLRAWTRKLDYNEDRVFRFEDYKNSGFSVRCVKD